MSVAMTHSGGDPVPVHSTNRGSDTGDFDGSKTVATTEDLRLVNDYRVQKPSLTDVCGKRPKVGLAQHRKGEADGLVGKAS